MELEKTAMTDGSPFTWSQGESLAELSKPERVKQIKEEYQARRERELKKRRRQNPLIGDLELTTDEIYGCEEGKGSCAFCMK